LPNWLKAAAVLAPGAFCVPLKGCSSIVLCPAVKISAQQLKIAFGRLFWGFCFCFSPLFAEDFSGLVTKIRLFRLNKLLHYEMLGAS